MAPKTIAWNVDTQVDFMRPEGSLYVQGAEDIEDTLAELTGLFARTGTKVVNTRDWHTLDDAEIETENYDFKETYPPHCMAETPGAEYVPATQPTDPLVVTREQKRVNPYDVERSRNIVVNKNKFDVFTGSPHIDTVLGALDPQRVIVYGVATNVCVDHAVKGLLNRVDEVYVVQDAIKELPPEQAQRPLEQVLGQWDNGTRRATLINSTQVEEYLR